MIAFRNETLASVASTNDVVLERALAGEPEGLVVRALEQRQGRGRHGRDWASPAGNLYVSILLRPGRPMHEVASLALVAGLSLADTLEALAKGRFVPRLKWPNDVLVDDAKLAGILLESATSRGAPFVVVGIGVNVESSPHSLPYPATSLTALGVAVSAETVLEGLTSHLEADYAAWQRAGFSALRERWLGHARGQGSSITVKVGEHAVSGVLQTVDAAGRLVLETAAGRRLLDAGELFFAAPKGAPCGG